MTALIGQKRPVPFIRAYPDGTRGLSEIERPVEIHALATKFIAHGGRYLIAAIGDGTVELVAAMPGDDDIVKVASHKVPNGHALPAAVDDLVRASVERLDAVQ